MKQERKTLALLALLGTAIIWGASFVSSKIVLREIDIISIVTIRFFIAALILIPTIIYYSNKSKRMKFRDWMKIIFLGLLNVPLYFMLETTGLEKTNAIQISLIIALIPLVVSVISMFFKLEKATALKTIGLFLGLVGAIFVVTNGKLDFLKVNTNTIGIASGLGAVMIASVFIILAKKWSKGHNPILYNSYLMLAGSIMMIMFGLFVVDFGQIAQLSLKAWLNLLYLGIGCSFLSFTLQFYALSHLTPTQTSLVTYVQPIITFILAAIILKEIITTPFIIGAFLTLSGVYFVMKE